MLNGIHPLLTQAWLMVFADMGHGHEAVLADANVTASPIVRSGSGVLPVIRSALWP